MKKVLAIFSVVFALLFLGIVFFGAAKHKVISDLSVKPVANTTPKAVKSRAFSSGEEVLSLFVPYWELGNTQINDPNVSEFIYFGISGGSNGIDKTDDGYKGINTFVDLTPYNKNKLLTLRLLDNDENIDILENKSIQSKIIKEAVGIARENEFDGIVLDLELKAIPFDSVVESVDEFIKDFHIASNQGNLSFQVLTYGDNFYRARPFNVKNIGENSDGIIIMAYDFHKSSGSTPGPNFPLSGKDKYGYDLESMIADFTDKVDPSRLTVAFGLYGYDWTVSEANVASQPADAMSLNKINQDYIFSCNFVSCKKERDAQSAESKIEYIDEDNTNHEIWYEDLESVAKKKEYLLQSGINKFSYWAYNYY